PARTEPVRGGQGKRRVTRPRPEVAADEERGDRLRRPACPRDQVGEWCPERDIVDPGPRDGARQRDDGGARLSRRPTRTEPGGPAATDQGEVRERLDVLDEGGLAAEPAFEWIGRLRRRLGGAAADRGDERGLLARDKAVRHAGEAPADTVAPFAQGRRDRRPLVDRA